MNLIAGFADIAPWQLAMVAAVALFASVVGGVAGYGTGALMPLVLVPIVGAEPVVPIIAISSMFSNSSRLAAFFRFADFRRALVVVIAAIPGCVIGAYAYTLLSNAGALIVIGSMLALSVPLRRFLKRRGFVLGRNGLAAAAGWGVVAGGTSGAGIILLSLLMAAGLDGAAVIATDAVISMAIGVVKVGVFGFAHVLTPQVVAVALLIGLVALPGAFLARKFVERMPVHVHTAILDAVVILGGLFTIAQALRV